MPGIVSGVVFGGGGGASLSLSTRQFATGTSAGAILAAIGGTFPGGTTTLLTDGFGGRVSVDSATKTLKAATTLTDGTGSIKIRDVSADGKQATEQTFDVAAAVPVVAPTLQTLGLSSSTFSPGAAAGTVIGSITGKTAGSTITVTPNDGRLAVSSDGSQLLVGVSASSAGTINATLTETLAGATGSPKDTAVSIVVGAAAGVAARAYPAGAYAIYSDIKVVGSSRPCKQIKRVSDSALLDIGYTAANECDYAAEEAFRTAVSSTDTVRIAKVYDHSGNNNDLVFTARTNLNAPKAGSLARGFMMLGDGLTGIDFPALTLDPRALSVFRVIDFNTSNQAMFIEALRGTPSINHFISTDTNGIAVQQGNGNPVAFPTRELPTFRPSFTGFQSSAASFIEIMDARETTLAAAAAGAITSGQLGYFLNGGIAETSFNGSAGFWRAYAIYPTATVDRAAVKALMIEPYPNSTEPTAGVLVCDGSSISNGSGSTYLQNQGRQTEKLLNKRLQHHNRGIGGRNLQTCFSTVNRLTQLFDSSKPNNIAFLEGGAAVNSIGGGTLTAELATIYQNYANAVHAAGGKLVVGGGTPRNLAASNYDSTKQAEIVTFNNWLRANWASFADGFADIASDPIMGNPASLTNTTYFADQVHPANAGYAILASYNAPAINGILV